MKEKLKQAIKSHTLADGTVQTYYPPGESSKAPVKTAKAEKAAVLDYLSSLKLKREKCLKEWKREWKIRLIASVCSSDSMFQNN